MKTDNKKQLFLSEADLLNLDLYEYHGGEYSYLDNILNPFWIKVAYAFPNWFAPNLITLTGLIINIVAAVIVAAYDPLLKGDAPAWAYISAGICLQIYGTLDAADGKQARRLKCSSPLGQIFDHGCDAVNLIFIIICCCSGLGLGIGKTTTYIITSMYFCFVVAQLIEYHSNILISGSKIFGVTEAMLISTTMFFITAIKGKETWDIELANYIPQLRIFKNEVPIKYFCSILMIVAVVSTCIMFVIQIGRKESPIPIDKRGNKNLGMKSFILRFIPPTIIFISGYSLLTSKAMIQFPLYIIFLIGLTFAFLSIRVNISHLCRRRLSYRFSGMYPLIVVTVNNWFGWIRNDIIIPFCFCLFLVMFTSFVILTINQIKEHLHIRAFHVVAKTE